MPTSHLRKAQAQVDRIVEAGISPGNRRSDRLLEEYIRQFYLHMPYEFLAGTKPAFLFQAAAGSWEFIRERDKDTPRKVRVFNPTIEEHGWQSPRTIVELSLEDSPFILDSSTAEILRHRYKIYEVMHPILKLARNGSGIITALYERDADPLPEGAILESSIHFQISHIADEEERRTLERDVENALFFVSLSVGDWPKMARRVQDIIRELEKKPQGIAPAHVEETREFLGWLLDNNFVFLGIRDYDFVDNKGREKLRHSAKHDLGIFRAEQEGGTVQEAQPRGITSIPDDAPAAHGRQGLKEKSLLEITKSARKSLVHRPVHMDYIGIKKYGQDGEIIGETRLLGLFTSAVYYQSATRIPIIRRKLESVLRRSGFPANSHNGKTLLAVLETYPRDELLQSTEEDLFHIGMGIVGLSDRPQTRLFVRRDRLGRFVSCLVFVPRDRFNTQLREKMRAILEKAFGGEMTDYHTQVTESPLARIHYFLRLQESEGAPAPDLAAIEEELDEASTGWHKGLHDTLVQVHEERAGEQLYLRYVDAFPESFRNSYHFGGTARDIFKIEEAYHRNDLSLDLYQQSHEEEDAFHLKLYHPDSQVALSEVLPILENMGFRGIDERTFFATPAHQKTGVWIHHFRLRLKEVERTHPTGKEAGKVDISSFASIKPEFEEALFHVWHKRIEDDGFNALILSGHLKWRDVVMLRAYSRYAIQTSYAYSHAFTASVIARYPDIACDFTELFHARFSPALSEKEREDRQKASLASLARRLTEVKNSAEDRVIRQMQDTMLATLRTNFFQTLEDGTHKPYLSFKFDSAKVPNLPLPKPHAEIFVYAPEVEGVHLRGGKVARGGLRWSDRLEDFRTEVLGLVKAQMVKNAVIVPVGSKGGFVVKRPAASDREAWLEQGKSAYRIFLRGLLDLTDNIVKGKIVPPKRVVRHDGDDPYLVVAADKGTATFSDIANGIAQEYGFWLDDAFASGGSVGYDHKKMGITAKGAWVSVERHFSELGLNIAKDDFTVVGIGDMSGDVFGNGMLLSKHIRMLAAFNHQHIFLDPSPDAAVSFKERVRMFKLPRSTWEDYNPKLISEGGGIFSRGSKSITISKQVKECFGLTKDRFTPEELMRALLMAPVDLLWNGGIGTYVKSSEERNEEVGDRTNDALRVNGNELRCRVVAEGGNLGLTQRGRIEYAEKGGKINTDAIDNSAGVDCSDHEVNIKIALSSALEKKKLTLDERNDFLAGMTDEVGALVLRDNFLQTQVISIAEQRGYLTLESNTRLIRMLEEKKLLDRTIEFLPTDTEIAERQAAHKGLTRPELSVMLAYSKIYVYDELVAATLPDDPHFIADLMLYFPAAMRERFRDEIIHHPLKREIIATWVANSIVNRMGCTFFYRMKEDTGMKGCDVARAYTIARDAFRLRELWLGIEEASEKIPADVQTRLFLDVRRMTERAISWFLRNTAHPLDTGGVVAAYQPGIAELEGQLDRILPQSMKDARDARLAPYVNVGVPQALAKKIASLDVLASACDIVKVANASTLPIRVIGDVYYRLGTRLKFDWLRERATGLWSHSYWDNLAVQTMTETLFDHQMRLTAEVAHAGCEENACGAAMEAWEKSAAKALERYDGFLNDLARQEHITAPMLTVAIQRAGGLLMGGE